MTHPPGPRDFATTHWSLVVAAHTDADDESRARDALAELCRAYWYPLYAYVRYRGHSRDDAQDLTQSFFARILDSGGFATADPERGRFRAYLLGAMKHFLANEWHRARAKKRGGGMKIIELDALDDAARRALEPTSPDDPDAGFDRDWAQESIGRALEFLRKEARGRGKGEAFELLKANLTGEESNHAENAARLGMSEGAVKVAVHRLRQRYREVLRAEIAKTVSDPADIDDEMRHLVNALRGG